MTKYYPILVETNSMGHAGKWAVASGIKKPKYYLTTVCDTREEAQKQCVLWTLSDLQRKMDDVYCEAVADGILEDVGLGEYLC